MTFKTIACLFLEAASGHEVTLNSIRPRRPARLVLSMTHPDTLATGQRRHMNQFQRNLNYFALLAAGIFVLISSANLNAQTRQQHVHARAHSVMPFEMSKTTHIFKMTEFGGVQKIVAKDPSATDQIALIRKHLQHEAKRFQQGDFSDPAKLHGADMPGLKDLQAGASRIKVSYAPLPSGAEIQFETTDLHLLTAVHRWFGAQLSEHGADAMAE